MSAAVTRGHSHLLGTSTEPLTFRVRGSEHHGRVLHIRSSKCLIGSAPGCTLRLRAAGLSPYHCLIVRGEAGVFARRWSPDTCLNGRSFELSRLLPGDRLEIGPIVLELLEPTPKDPQRELIWPLSGAVEANTPCAETATQGESAAAESTQQPFPTSGPDSAEQTDRARRERDELDRRCQELSGQLAEAHHARDELQASLDRIRQEASQKQAGYLAALEDVRKELSLLRQRHDQQLAHQEDLVKQAQAAGGEVRALREQLQAAGQQSEIDGQGLNDENQRIREELGRYEEQNTALTAQLQLKEHQWSQQAAQWETTERELRGQLQASLNDLDESRLRLEELTAQVRATSQQLGGGDAEPSHATVNPAATADPPPSSGDEIARRLRDELDQSRDEHRRACEEWHRDRQNLEQELAQRGETLSQLERKYKEDNEARQVLLHELQQEAKRMTAELEEARLANRPAAEERKQQAPTVHYEPPSVAKHSAPAETECFPAAGYVAKPADNGPSSPADETTACPTQLMDREELVQLRLVDPETPETPTLVLSSDQPTLADQDHPLQSSGTEVSQHQVPADRPTGGAPVRECPAAQAGDTVEDDEGIIQQYMARLLQRIAGTAPAEKASVEHGSSTTSGPTHASDDCQDPVDAPRAESAPERAAEAKPAAPAMVADLLAMRELANRSTRRAIDDSDQRRQMARATSELVVALVCTAASAAMMITSQRPLSPQALSGALGLCFGGMMLIRTLRMFWSYRRRKRKANGSDADPQNRVS